MSARTVNRPFPPFRVRCLGYAEIGRIPQGARNIRIEEVSESTNYIAIQGSDGEFYLNGEWFIQWSGEYPAAGTTLFYQREGEKELLHAPGPIKEDIIIYVSCNLTIILSELNRKNCTTSVDDNTATAYNSLLKYTWRHTFFSNLCLYISAI